MEWQLKYVKYVTNTQMTQADKYKPINNVFNCHPKCFSKLLLKPNWLLLFDEKQSEHIQNTLLNKLSIKLSYGL